MHLSFAARICDTDYVLKNDFTDVGVLKPFDEVTCIVGTTGNDDPCEQSTQPVNGEGNPHKGKDICPGGDRTTF